MLRLLLLVVLVIGISIYWFGLLPVLPPNGETTATSARAITTELRERIQDGLSEAGSVSEPVRQSDQSAVEIERDAAFTNLYPLTLGRVIVMASVATTTADRVLGLSGTKSMPAGVVKLFVFPEEGPQSMWMKDMNYPIDIIWLDSKRKVVHIAPAVDPSTYPDSFGSPTPARYVIETNAGFATEQGIIPGTVVELPTL